MHNFLKAFESSRKKGKHDPKAQQTSFHFSYEKYGIKDVQLLITKKPMNKRFKVDVLMNLEDRRSVVLKNNDDLGRIHCILQVTLPVVEYDIHGHINRHDGRRSQIDVAMAELKGHKVGEFVASTGLYNQDACEMIDQQINGRNGQTYIRFADELLKTSFSFKEARTIDNFSEKLINSCCMIVKHFGKDEKGKIDRLPGRYYFFYVDTRSVDRLPTAIADAKVFLNNILTEYGNFKFYNFCAWMIDLMKAEFGEGFDPDIICAIEDERMAKRTMKFDKTSAPSGRHDNRRSDRKQIEEEDRADYKADDVKPSKRRSKRVSSVNAQPSGVSIGDMFGSTLDQAIQD